MNSSLSRLRNSENAAILTFKWLSSDDNREMIILTSVLYSSQIHNRTFQAPTRRDRLRLNQGDRHLVNDTSAPSRDTLPQSDPGMLPRGFPPVIKGSAQEVLPQRGFSVSQRTLDTIDQSRRDRLNGKAELFAELRRKTVRVRRVDKEADV